MFGILLGDEEKIEFYETFEIDNTGKNKLKKQQTIFVSFFDENYCFCLTWYSKNFDTNIECTTLILEFDELNCLIFNLLLI